MHLKPRPKQRSLKQNTLNFARIFCAAIKNFLAFTLYFFALPQLSIDQEVHYGTMNTA